MSSSDKDEITDSDDDDPDYTPKTRKMDDSRKKRYTGRTYLVQKEQGEEISC
jgi:hypothetical protein